LKEFGSRLWPEKGDNLRMLGENLKMRADD